MSKRRRQDDWKREAREDEPPPRCGCMACRPLRPPPPGKPRVYIRPPPFYYSGGALAQVQPHE